MIFYFVFSIFKVQGKKHMKSIPIWHLNSSSFFLISRVFVNDEAWIQIAALILALLHSMNRELLLLLSVKKENIVTSKVAPSVFGGRAISSNRLDILDYWIFTTVWHSGLLCDSWGKS